MNYFTLFAIIVLSAAANAEEDYILVHEVTEETYVEFLNQYSESCRPHVTRWVGAASLAAAKFNEGSYYEADSIVQRHVKPGDFKRRTGSAAIMFSEECTEEDLRLTIAQGEALMPMIQSISCMLRVADGDRSWAKAKEAASNMELDDTASIRTVHQLVTAAIFAVNDVIDDEDGGACKHIPQERFDNIITVRTEWERVRDELTGILENG